MASMYPEYGEHWNDNRSGESLATAVWQREMWPTPAARDHKGPGLPSRQGGQDLPTAVRRWPTPVASDAGTDRGSSAGWGLRNAVGGLLNPTWVEWLMGYPAGWTDCED